MSLAAAHAAAKFLNIPLYRHLGGSAACTLPVPILNILNGGKHAHDSTELQEFMGVPSGAYTFGEALRIGIEVYHTLKSVLQEHGLNTNVGDEGGFAPSLKSNRQAVEMIVKAIEKAGYKPGKDCFIALDPAASSFYEQGKYHLVKEKATLTSKGTWSTTTPAAASNGHIAYHSFREELNLLGHAGSDFVLMPSRYEPCGLPQMIGPRFGALPVVRATGGLKDTVSPMNEDYSTGNGFVFEAHTSAALAKAVADAVRFHREPDEKRARTLQRVMSESLARYTLANTAREYIKVYEPPPQRGRVTIVTRRAHLSN